MGFGITQNERRQMGPLGILAALEAAVADEGADTIVWSDGTRVWTTRMDDVDTDDGYEMATLGELLAEYREAVS